MSYTVSDSAKSVRPWPTPSPVGTSTSPRCRKPSVARGRAERRRLRAIGPTVSSQVRCKMRLRPTQSFWRSRSESIARWHRPCRTGRTNRIIDAMNTLAFPLKKLDGLPSSAFVAKAFPGAKLVKGFNHLIAATLAADPIVEGGHRVVFLSSDDEEATASVAALARQLGFTRSLANSTRVAHWSTHATGSGAP